MSSARFYTHECRDCGLTFRLIIFVHKRGHLRTRCPDCKTKVLFDNTDGGLETLKRTRLLSRPIRQYYLKPGIDYIPEPEPSPPEPEPVALDAPAIMTEALPPKPTEISAPAEVSTPMEPANARPKPRQRLLQRFYLRRMRALRRQREILAVFFAGVSARWGVRKERAQRFFRRVRESTTSFFHTLRYNITEGWSARMAMFTRRRERFPYTPRESRESIGERLRALAERTFGPLQRRGSSFVRSCRDALTIVADRVRFFFGGIGRRIVQFGERLRRRSRRASQPTSALVAVPALTAASAATFSKPGGRLASILQRIGAALRPIFLPDIPTHYLITAYLCAPLLLLMLYGTASYFFPPLALPESTTALEGRLAPVQPNRILDRSGELLAELFFRKTSDVRPGELPDTLRRKIVFIEDESFYDHGGFRPLAIGRAFGRNIVAGRYVEGGSTITQQVARIALRNHERSLLRKFQEAVLAAHLERRLSKAEILNSYVNHVYLGHGAYGFEVAAEFYFHRPLNDLNFTEELMLVTLLPGPEEYSPLRNPALLEQRMDLLYNRMVREDFLHPPAQLYREQKNTLFAGFDQPPSLNVFADRVNRAPYVAEYVRLNLVKLLGRAVQYDSGLVIHTTIDGAMQDAAVRETVRFINEIAPRYPPYRIDENGKPVRKRSYGGLVESFEEARLGLEVLGVNLPRSRKARLQAAAVGIDPETGGVLFLQGGSGFGTDNQLNRAVTMRRQTGSAIKPIIFSAGVESGRISPASIIEDEAFPEDGPGLPEDPEWKPRNYKDRYHGKVTARYALAKSLNVPSVKIGSRVGMSRIADHFRKFFFPNEQVFANRFRRDLTVAIGSLEMSPLEMAAAYAAFGNNGVIHRPHLIERIESADGELLFSGTGRDEFSLRVPEERTAISGDVAHVMASLLRDSAKMGGTYYSNGSQFLGKTGTSNANRDAWFVGVVPGLSAAVWVGYDNPANSMGRATGASTAGPLWGRIVSRGYRVGGKRFHFDPHGVYRTVCVKTGHLARAQCPHKRDEIFPRNVKPPRCERHGGE